MRVSVVGGFGRSKPKTNLGTPKKARHKVGLQSHLKQTAPAQGGEAGNGMPLAVEFIR
jgi:hypothetical protein